MFTGTARTEKSLSRPEVDAEWTGHSRQAGMKKPEFVVAINTDKDAPIGEVADVLVVADLKQLVPVLTEKLASV